MKSLVLVCVALLCCVSMTGCVDPERVAKYQEAMDMMAKLKVEMEAVVAKVRAGEIKEAFGSEVLKEMKAKYDKLAEFAASEGKAIAAAESRADFWKGIGKTALTIVLATAARGQVSKGPLSVIPLIGRKPEDPPAPKKKR